MEEPQIGSVVAIYQNNRTVPSSIWLRTPEQELVDSDGAILTVSSVWYPYGAAGDPLEWSELDKHEPILVRDGLHGTWGEGVPDAG